MSCGFRFGACFLIICSAGSFFIPSVWKQFFNVLKACCSLKWAATVTVKELFYSNLDRLACRSSSVVFLREKSLVLFVATRWVWDVVLFSSGRKVVYLYCSLPLDQFGTSCCFPQGGKSSVWIVCRRSTSLERCAVFSGRKDCLFIITQLDVLSDFPPLNKVRTSCCFFQGKYSSICIVYRCSTNLECRAVFFREKIDFACLWLLELMSD